MQDRLKQLTNSLLAFVFPTICVNCGKEGPMLCADCVQTLPWLQGPICPFCGQMMTRPAEKCFECVKAPLPIKQIRAAFRYAEPIPHIIHQFKYENRFALAEPLAVLMAEAWPRWQTAVDLIIPVPMHKTRQRKRGYNQSALLARKFSAHINLPYSEETLQRIRHTRPQVGLNGRARLANLNGAFDADGRDVHNKDILLIDDVCTTGATLVVAAKTLLAAGANSVSGYCLARTT
jgi:ComF family protein